MRRLILAVSLCACSATDPQPLTPAPPAPTLPDTTQAEPGPPVAAVRPMRDTYHGVVVEDRYQWLEGETPEVKAWSDGQNAWARKKLDAIPERTAIRTEVAAIIDAPRTVYFGMQAAGGKVFAFRKSPKKEQPELVHITDLEHPEKATVLLDPTAGGGAHRSVDWFVPAPDGKRLAVSVSENGSEIGSLHLLDLTGKELEPPLPNVQRPTGGGDVAWAADGKGLYYTRYPAKGEPHAEEPDFWMQVWFHEIGKPVSGDRYEAGQDFPKIAEVRLESDARGRVMASIQNGDGGAHRHLIRDAKGKWTMLADWADLVPFAGFADNGDVWMVSRKDAPRGKVMRLPAASTSLAQAKVVVPQGKDNVVTDFFGELGVHDGGDRAYVTYQLGGPSEIRAFGANGEAKPGPALPPASSVGRPLRHGDGVLVAAQGYTRSFSRYRFSPKTGKTEVLAALSPEPTVDLSTYEVTRDTATSKDGTVVPFTVIAAKGAPRDGSMRCLATGYGGYAISQEPGFVDVWAPLLRRGVCLVFTNLRGGGEFGEEWHKAGALTRKQNVFDDFAAVLQQLVQKKYSSRERLAIIGGSNGGLLMGATLTQHPELVKAAVVEVGVLDMLRVERFPNGSFNVPEYGTVADKAQFTALHAYSPYHHVTAKTPYPATLFMTGETDGRVAPWHSRKMVAAMQAARSGNAPILLRTSSTSGHGQGTASSEQIEQLSDVIAFVHWQLR
jgi:prolyl oligopeptidase